MASVYPATAVSERAQSIGVSSRAASQAFTRLKGREPKKPRRADKGWPGEERWIWLRLKLIADVGLVGLPNAGKSTFLAATSNARPKIADYPFTTLHPGLGVVKVGDREFVMADIPGLIEGASEGAGLGTRFLGHVERCRALLHLVDGTQDDVVDAYKTVRAELKAYGGALARKKELVALNKTDATTYGVPAAVDNDANLAALGEHRLRFGPDEHSITVKAGTAIGAGIIVGGRVHRGATGAAGDITHTRIDSSGDIPCSCGNTGCLETVASGASLVRQMHERGRTDVMTTDEVLALAWGAAGPGDGQDAAAQRQNAERTPNPG